MVPMSYNLNVDVMDILALYIQTRGDFIVGSDLMKPVFGLIYKQNANWTSTVEILDDDIYCGGENNFNLYTV